MKHKINMERSLPDSARKWNVFMRKGTLSCTCGRASYTLEAAVILPLMAAFFTFLLFFFRVLQVEASVQTALYDVGRKTAAEAAGSESDPLLYASAEVLLLKELSACDCVGRYVNRGAAGVSLLSSDFSGEYVDIEANYFIKFPINFFLFSGVSVSQGVKCRKWTGDGADTEEAADYVYVTETGTVYHCSRDCTYLSLSIRKAAVASLVSLRNKEGHKYYACEQCLAGGAGTGDVYITDYGTRYHIDLACSGLKRIIYRIPLEDVGERPPCTKCGHTAVP